MLDDALSDTLALSSDLRAAIRVKGVKISETDIVVKRKELLLHRLRVGRVLHCQCSNYNHESYRVSKHAQYFVESLIFIEDFQIRKSH